MSASEKQERSKTQKLGRALIDKAKKEKEARSILGAQETPAQKAKKTAEKTKKEKAKAKQLQADDSGACRQLECTGNRTNINANCTVLGL